MAVLIARFDVPDADPEVDPDEILAGVVERFNDWVRGLGRDSRQVGLEVREATWED